MAATILFSSLVIAQPGTPHPCLFPSQFTTMVRTYAMKPAMRRSFGGFR